MAVVLSQPRSPISELQYAAKTRTSFLVVLPLPLLLLVAYGGGNTGGQSANTLPANSGNSPATTQTSSGSLPTPPAQAVTFSSIQSAPGWGSCNTANCTGGSGAGQYWMAQNQASPSLSGNSTELYNSGVWANALWWNKLGASDQISNFLSDFYFQVNDASQASAQALEFDAFHFVGGYNYMMGGQCNYANRTWDVWDEFNGHGRHTPIACPKFQAGIWHHVIHILS